MGGKSTKKDPSVGSDEVLLAPKASAALPRILGSEDASIDTKGRLFVPKRMREFLGDSFAIGLGGNGSIRLYPKVIWEQMFSRLERAKKTAVFNDYVSLVVGNTEEDRDLDSAFRVLLPAKMRRLLGITSDTKEMTLVGAIDYIEAWTLEGRDDFQVGIVNPRFGRMREVEQAFHAELEAQGLL